MVDDGLMLQGSKMLVPKSLQLYANASKVWGEHGDPWDAGIGINWWPYQRRGLRLNSEVIYVRDSPIGSLLSPYGIGANGWILNANAEVAF